MRPAALDFGTLTYDPNSCYSSNYRDAEGHDIAGVEVDFKLTAKNTGQVKSGYIWIVVHSIDWFDTDPILFDFSWPGGRWYEIDSQTMMIRGPEVLPGKSRPFSWTVLFVTPFDPHYEISVRASGEEPRPDDVTGDPAAFWDDIWTSNTICF